MGFFSRLKTGWALAMDSFAVLRHQPELVVFPILSAIAGAIYVGLIFGGNVALLGFQEGPGLYATLFLVYLGSSFIAAFFSAALMASTKDVFEGEEPSLKKGLAAAWKKRQLLFAWAMISAIVGVILRVVERQNSIVADIAAMLFSVAWGILTYFIIPVILFEDVSVTSMFERSGKTFTDTWGETVGAGFGVGLIQGVFFLVGLIVAFLIFFALGGSGIGLIVAIAVGIITMIVAVVVGATLTGIAKTALYVYASEGIRPSEFDNVDFEHPTQ